MKKLIHRSVLVRRTHSGLRNHAVVSSRSNQHMAIRRILHTQGQSAHTPRIQRKIRTSGPDISNYLIGKGIRNFSGPSASNVFATSGIYYHPSMSRQILYAMLSSGRVFEVMGGSLGATTRALDEHIKARKGVVDISANKKFGFATGYKVRMNTQGRKKNWQKTYYIENGRIKLRWWYKPGADKLAAMKDAYKNPSKYSIACWAAAKITMHAGSNSMSLVRDRGVAAMDWVPGDWGYIKNTRHKGRPGYEGINIIYVGNNSYWAHTSNVVTTNTLTGWELVVASWGKAKLMDWRQRTGVGVF